MSGAGIPTTPQNYPPLSRQEKVGLLLDAFGGVELGSFDLAVVRKLAGEPATTVRTLASMVARARALSGGWPPSSVPDQ